MANPEHLAILKQGVESRNRWRREPRESDATDFRGGPIWALRRDAFLEMEKLAPLDLQGADLNRSSLQGVNLAAVDLRGADLSRTNLSDAQLSFAVLSDAKLRSAWLDSAQFPYAVFNNADLSFAHFLNANMNGALLYKANCYGTNLRGAYFHNAHLKETNFAGAKLADTTFADTDLSVAVALDAVVHQGPSTVGVDTIYKSQGKIPEVFLRGCGVPEEFIRYIGSMVGRPIEFYSCFISYSTKDQEFADRLYADLQNRGVRCWFAPHDIQGGRKIHEQLDEAIRLHDKLLLILSEASMNSDWVGTEIANALQKTHPSNTGLGGAPAREGKQMLFPISIVPYEKIKSWKLFDADRGKDSAREIREYFIPDFSNWKDHDSYQKAFQRLVSDLKQEKGGAPDV